MKKRRKLQNSFFNAANLKVWTENPNNKDYCEITPCRYYWFKSAFYEYEAKEKRSVAYNSRALVKPDIDPSLNQSKSKNFIHHANQNQFLPSNFSHVDGGNY